MITTAMFSARMSFSMMRTHDIRIIDEIIIFLVDFANTCDVTFSSCQFIFAHNATPLYLKVMPLKHYI